jgi:pyruvate formate lyase activating enzyme
MRIGLRKTSLVDYPGKVAAALFFPGCNLRCPWCHNRDLVIGGVYDGAGTVDLEDALAHIEKRRSVLGGVVLSGGEPTLYKGLNALIEHIKGLGLAVKLDTNGMAPAILKKLFARPETRPDYIALDLKLSPDRYGELLGLGVAGASAPGTVQAVGAAPVPGGTCSPGEALRQSAALIRSSGIAHEFRSLALPKNIFGPPDIEALAELAGDSPWYFRPFRPGNCLDMAWDEFPGSTEAETEVLTQMARKAVQRPGNG